MSTNLDFVTPEQARALLDLLDSHAVARDLLGAMNDGTEHVTDWLADSAEECEAIAKLNTIERLQEIAAKQWHLCVGNFVWGRGLSPELARAAWKASGGHGRTKPQMFRFGVGAYDVHVNDMAGLSWRGATDAKPVELVNYHGEWITKETIKWAKKRRKEQAASARASKGAK